MRCREWYGWHFPEMGKIVSDNLVYSRTVKAIGQSAYHATVLYTLRLTADCGRVVLVCLYKITAASWQNCTLPVHKSGACAYILTRYWPCTGLVHVPIYPDISHAQQAWCMCLYIQILPVHRSGACAYLPDISRAQAWCMCLYINQILPMHRPSACAY